MRRKDREITDRIYMESILSRVSVCRLALADGNEPYVVPVCFGYEDGTIFFHSATEGKKMDIIRKNPRCCIEVDITPGPIQGENPCKWEMEYESVICTGTARTLETFSEKCAAMKCIFRHYAGTEHPFSEKELERVALVKIPVESMTGKHCSRDLV